MAVVEEAEGLALTAEEFAAAVRLTLTPENRSVVLEALYDAQADVEAHCGQPIPARTAVEDAAEDGRGGWVLANDPLTVVSSEPLPDGRWRVTYRYGRDDDRAVRAARRYVKAAALAALRDGGTVARGVRSVSVEGQAVSYDAAGSGDAALAGGPVSIKTLDRFRRVGVHSRPRVGRR